MKKYFYFLIFVTIFSCQEVDIDKLVVSMESVDLLESESIGFGSTSERYKKFKILSNNASEEKLLKLREHENASIAAYACYALIDNDLIAPSILFQKYLKNDRSVTSMNGCNMGSDYMSSIVYRRYWSNRIEYSDSEDDSFTINDSDELLKMDSLIIFNENPDAILLFSVFENRLFPKEYNSKIEEWAFNRKNLEAIKYVFKYIRKENEEKIQTVLRDILQNTRVYPSQKEEIIDIIKQLN